VLFVVFLSICRTDLCFELSCNTFLFINMHTISNKLGDFFMEFYSLHSQFHHRTLLDVNFPKLGVFLCPKETNHSLKKKMDQLDVLH
jgi:hypothetical protein